MSTPAVFLLLQTDPGRVAEAREYLAGVTGIVDVTATQGPFDLIASADVAGTDGVNRLLAECRRTPGLARLSRCHTVRR